MSVSNFVCVDSERIEASRHRTIPGGHTVLDAASGVFITADRAGNLDLMMPLIEAVGFMNAADLAEHAIDSDGVVVTHRIRFHGGGAAQIAFNLDGKFVSFRGEKILTESIGTLLLIGRLEHPSD
jgi:hypothetical protein